MNIEQEIRDQIERNKAICEEVGQMNCTLSKLENKCEQYMKDSDEAYQRGLAEGKKAFDLLDTERDAEYQRGLDEAMSAFKKLYSCGWERDWNAMGFEFNEGEWSTSFEFIIGHYTAAEIVEKVKAYEEKELHVGDEVIAPCGKAIVTTFKNDLVFYLYSVGDYGCTEPENLTKTGRHFDIQSILGAMKS